MCGRFAQRSPARKVAKQFKVEEVPPLAERYNVAPAQTVLAVREASDGREATLLKWGLVPRWAKDSGIGNKLINARSETVAEKPSFREAFARRRCLVPADGFFEWAKEGTKKVAHHFRLRGGGPMAFAGVWDVWKAEGQPTLTTCAIITVAANELVRPFHDRMPAVISPEKFGLWMGFDTPVNELLGALHPLPAKQLEVVRVGPAVNRVTNDSPECVAPAA